MILKIFTHENLLDFCVTLTRDKIVCYTSLFICALNKPNIAVPTCFCEEIGNMIIFKLHLSRSIFVVVVLVFKVQPTAKVIWRWSHNLVSSNILVKLGRSIFRIIHSKKFYQQPLIVFKVNDN